MTLAAPDGGVRRLFWTDRAIFDEDRRLVEFQGVGRDTTELRREEEESAATRVSFTSIVDNSSEAVLVLESQGLVVYGNASAARFLNKSQEELLGLPFGRPLSPGQVAEVEVFRLKGEVGIAEMSVEPTQWLGERATIIKFRDITERKRAEEEAEFKTRLLEGSNRILHHTLTSESEQDVALASLSTILEITGVLSGGSERSMRKTVSRRSLRVIQAGKPAGFQRRGILA